MKSPFSHPIHGMSHTTTYRTWSSMKDRCRNPANKRWKDYGGRGIKVDERWASFQNFLADMGVKPSGLTLERIDNNGNYSPTNCRWAPRRDQDRNKTTTIFLAAFGDRKRITDWAADPRCMVRIATLRSRIAIGVRPEIAITKPSKRAYLPEVYRLSRRVRSVSCCAPDPSALQT
jgi:hypothetical protein